jgi:hypothetical protein
MKTSQYIFIGFLILIIVLVLEYWFFQYNEGMSNGDKVTFIIPTTSKKSNFTDAKSCSLINVLYSSLKNFDISNYTFLIGIDDDDEFYLNNIDEIKSHLPENFHFRFLNNFDKSYVCIVNQLADLAINEYNTEYLFVFADDLKIFDLDYVNTFIDYFKKNNLLCLGWPIDETNQVIATHPFVHKKHVEKLGYFYPKEIKNWRCDNWVTYVYSRMDKIIKTDKPVFTNTMLAVDVARYDIVIMEDDELNKLVDAAVNVLSQ